MQRKKVANIMTGWLGAKQGSPKHHEILDIYNSYIRAGKAPEASKYIMTDTASWCAATVSAAYIKAGYGEYFPVECSCGRMIEIAKKHHWWVEADDYIPGVGDCIIYDFSDDGKGDNTTGHDHIGMVVDIVGKTFTVIEGNKGDMHVCDKRTKEVNSQYIRGFVVPPFKSETYYKVERGDSLIKIGRIYDVHWKIIASLNGIKFPYTIFPGQVLRIK